MEGEGDKIKSKQASKRDRTLPQKTIGSLHPMCPFDGGMCVRGFADR